MASETTEALRAFYETYAAELFAYAVSITFNEADAEDAVHDAFSAVLGAGSLPRELRPYVFRCVRNAAIDGRRTAARELQKCSIFSDDPDNGPVRVQVDEVLSLMSEEERECVVLKTYGGLTFRETAQVLGEPPGTVAARYWRALARVREKMEVTS